MKKHKNNELDVDFIGSQEPLTQEEQKQLSDYFKKTKKKKPVTTTKEELTE